MNRDVSELCQPSSLYSPEQLIAPQGMIYIFWCGVGVFVTWWKSSKGEESNGGAVLRLWRRGEKLLSLCVSFPEPTCWHEAWHEAPTSSSSFLPVKAHIVLITTETFGDWTKKTVLPQAYGNSGCLTCWNWKDTHATSSRHFSRGFSRLLELAV